MISAQCSECQCEEIQPSAGKQRELDTAPGVWVSTLNTDNNAHLVNIFNISDTSCCWEALRALSAKQLIGNFNC